MLRVALALGLAVLAGCSSGTRRVGKQPSWRDNSAAASPTKQVRPVVFAPASAAAARYNEPLQAPPRSALGDAAVAAVRDAAIRGNLPVPAADARLFRACAELAEVVSEDGVVGYPVIEFALQHHGIIEPSPHLLVVWGHIDEPELIVEQLRPRIAEILADGAHARVGIGSAKRNADGTGAVVFALQASGVATAPIPRSLPAGGSFVVEVVVESRYRDPELIVTHNDGSTEHLPVALGRSGAFKGTVACGKHIGRQQVEITASDKAGSSVLANFPVWCGTDPPSSITVHPTHDDDRELPADEAERRLLALVNRDRQAAGLAPLLWDDRVAAVSRGHSEDMRKTKIVAHISPTTGSAADRVRAAGIKTAMVLENVARTYGAGEAHASLMNSPGHRANVLAPQATHVGIGVVLGEGLSGRREMFITQVFTRVPPRLDRTQAVELVRQRLHAARPVGVDARLTSVAQDLADGLAAGKTRESLWPAAKKKLDAGNTAYARVASVITAMAELDTLDGKELLGDYKADDVGIGLSQGTHPEIGEGTIWLVVLVAEKLPKKERRSPRAERGEHGDVDGVRRGVERLAVDGRRMTRQRGADLVAYERGERRERRLAARDQGDQRDDGRHVVERLRWRHHAEPGSHDRRDRSVVEHDRARTDRAVAAADEVDRRGPARQSLEHPDDLDRRQVRRRLDKRRTGRRLEHHGARRAIEAERTLHERARGTPEHARPLERRGRLVRGVEPLEHDRTIEHRVDGAGELRDRCVTERGLELVARTGLVLLGELRDRVRTRRALAARHDARHAAELEGLELSPQIGERRRALLRILDEQPGEQLVPAVGDVRDRRRPRRLLAEVLGDEVGAEER
jgi:uncharacterized protein YkwD